jgi:hypothetical protein
MPATQPIKYLNADSLAALVGNVKRLTTNIYTVKGKAAYVDDAFLASAECPQAITDFVSDHSAQEAHGLWQLANNVWEQVTEFKPGWVYNIVNSFVTTSDFIEGAGKTITAGTNIVVVNIGGEQAPVLKFDVFATSIALGEYQLKQMQAPLRVFTNGTPTVYTAAASLPVSEAVADATITDGMIAVLGGNTDEAGDVYQAAVSVNDTDGTLNDIAWTKLGNQNTVEGAIHLLCEYTPNTPITAAEVNAMFED